MRRLLLLLPLLLSCHRAPQLLRSEPAPKQIEIATRDIKFVYDTVPVIRFKTPYIYGLLRLQVEACSGVTRNGWPAFYIAAINPLTPQGYAAVYIYDAEAIVFGLGAEASPQIIAHELLHWLLHDIGVKDHPPEWFGDATQPGRCGHLLRVER